MSNTKVERILVKRLQREITSMLDEIFGVEEAKRWMITPNLKLLNKEPEEVWNDVHGCLRIVLVLGCDFL